MLDVWFLILVILCINQQLVVLGICILGFLVLQMKAVPRDDIVVMS